MPAYSGNSDLYLSEVSPGDKPWETHRANSSTVQKLYARADYQRYASRIEQCSQMLGFALSAQDSGELKLKLNQARFCRVRLCPVCQWRRSLMWRARFFSAIPKVMEDYPTHRWVFLTLTIRNCPLEELKTTLQEMNRGWDRMVKRKQFPAVGFVRSTEVTRSPNGDAHPHFHCLLMVPSLYFAGKTYLNHQQWREFWQQALKIDYLPVVNVKAVKPKDGQIAIAVLETLKYGVKELDLVQDGEWLVELTRQLYKTRAVSVGGVLRQYLSEEEPEDLIHAEDEPIEIARKDSLIWFGWREMVKKYAKTERC